MRLPGRPARIWLGLASLSVSLVSGLALLATATTARADAQDIAVDRQAYVPDAGPDAYQANTLSGGGCSTPPCPDTADIHVGAAPNQSAYHSLLHIELSAIPSDDTVSSLLLTLTVTPDNASSENVNPGSWLLDAYPLQTELTPDFPGCTDSAQCAYPQEDRHGPEAVGRLVKDDSGNVTAVTFDVAPMLTYWQNKHVNTGLAVVPDAADSTQPWTVGFTRTLNIATATVTTPGGATTTFPSTTATHASTQAVVVPPPAASLPASFPSAASTPVAAPSAAATPAPRRAVPGTVVVQPASSGEVPAWLLVLGVSLAFSVALLAQPAAQAFSSAAGLRAGTLAQLKLHPRMVAVAGTLLLWSSGWGLYTHANGTGPSTPVASQNGGGAVAGIPSYAPAPSTPGASSSSSSSSASSSNAPGSNGGAPGSNGSSAPVGAAAFTGSAPVAPQANLYSGKDDTTGITDTTIQMCAHAALTFGPAFNIGASDLNVFWQMVDDPQNDPFPHTAGQAGIYNRKIVEPGGSPGISVQDDGYQPSKAIQAAQACQNQQGGDFFLLSGIGFDQIPGVRIWAEQNHMLYIHHIATQARGLQYSFTMLPTLEQVGTQFGEYYLAHLNGKKIGIIERQSSNWSPGIATFKAALKSGGVSSSQMGPDDPVTNNQGDYTKEILDMKAAGVDVVLLWENALADDEIIQQANNQSYNPKWLLFPFNLTLYTLNSSGVDTSGMQGIVPWPAYTSSSARCGSGGSGVTRTDADYAQFMNEIKQFEAAYARYDPGANLCGDGGDLLFGTWEAWRQVADLLVQCGVHCTRNGIAGVMLNGYRSQVGANCTVDFSTGDHHHGGYAEDIYVVKQENGGPGWINTGYCETNIQ